MLKFDYSNVGFKRKSTVSKKKKKKQYMNMEFEVKHIFEWNCKQFVFPVKIYICNQR